jgi:release factor glutamine methyltransferase
MTIRETLAAAIPRLTAAGVETPRLDAELLLAHVLQRGRTHLFAHPEAVLSDKHAVAYAALLRRREAREPLPYLLGTWEFLGMSFRVGPGVLIPRPETETLVEAVAERLPSRARVLDVGAGSGCICAGLARLRPDAAILGLEPSAEALHLARQNIEVLGFGDRVRLIAGRFPEDATELGPLDALVSNPPYIPSAEVDVLAPELRRYEPRGALDGGADGLDVLGPLTREGALLVKPGGLFAVEVAQGQAEQVCALLRATGEWNEPETVADLAGVDRVVLSRRK